MELKEVQGTSKKTGKPFKGYCVMIGEYQTPLFFPSKVELIYIKEHMKKTAGSDFWSDLDGEEN